MADVIDRPPAPHPDMKPSNTIIIDGDFLRDQAVEAIATFFAPFHGVVTATTDTARRRRRRMAMRKRTRS